LIEEFIGVKVLLHLLILPILPISPVSPISTPVPPPFPFPLYIVIVTLDTTTAMDKSANKNEILLDIADQIFLMQQSRAAVSGTALCIYAWTSVLVLSIYSRTALLTRDIYLGIYTPRVIEEGVVLSYQNKVR